MSEQKQNREMQAPPLMRQESEELIRNETINESGAVGEEQCPAGVQKTDKHEWDLDSTKNKKEHLLPESVREIFDGL